MRVKSLFLGIILTALLTVCISVVATAGSFGKNLQKSTIPILRTEEDCIKLAEKRLADDIKYSRGDTSLIGAKLSEPFPYFNAYEETIAYSFDVIKEGKHLAFIEVDRISDSVWAAFDMVTVSDTIFYNSFAYHNPGNIQKCLTQLERKGFKSDKLELTNFYYFPCVTGGVKRGSSVLAGFKVSGTNKLILIDPVSFAILPDTVTLMDLQKECEREFPIIQDKARHKQKEHEEYLRKKGIKFNLNFAPERGPGDDEYNVDFHGEVTGWKYDWLGTKCVAGACATVLDYWTEKDFLKQNPPQVYADDFEEEWGTDGGLPPSRMPDDIITAFINITEKHKLDEDPYEFDTKGFLDIHSYYGELLLKHPVDLNFLKGNREPYCKSHACTGVGLKGLISAPTFVLYTGWDRFERKPPYFLNSNYIAVSTWPNGLPPVVISTDPPRGAEGVDIYAPITITFDREMDQSTVSSGTVLFNPVLHGSFSTEWSSDGKTVTLTLTNPQEDLELYTNYTVTVTDSAKDTLGVILDGDRDDEPGGNYPFSFTTKVPMAKLDPKAYSVSIKEGGGGSFSIEIINGEQRSVEVSLTDAVANPGGWTTTPASGSHTLAPSQTMPLSYSVVNDAAENNLYHQFNLTLNGVNLDNAEHSYSPWKKKEPDHPDEGPIVDPRYPTPWYLDTESQVGILLNGCSAGIGHLLGKYKINTCAVKKENLRILGEQNRSLSDLSVLIIPTGGLMGLENVTSFIQGLEDFVEQGGTVFCLTQQYGYNWYILPNPPSGYGWREDQSCYNEAGYFSDWDVILSGQNSAVINTHIDGFFTDIPMNSKVIMKRRISGMAELFHYDYGLGKVLVCGLYTDWGYGQAQWSLEEANLIRDIVTWSLDVNRPIQEYYGGDAIDLDIPVHYYTTEDSLPANKVRVKILDPSRDSIYSTELSISPPLYPENSTIVNLTGYSIPSNLGIYPVNYSLYNDTLLLQEEELGERFAVKMDIPVGEYILGDFSIWATVESEGIPYGSDAIYTIFVRNSTASPFTGKVMIGVHEQGGVWWQIVDSLIDTEIPPDTFITLSYSRPLYKSTSTYFGLYEVGAGYYQGFLTNAIVRCQKGIWIVPSDCYVRVTTDKEKYFKSEHIIYNIEAINNISDSCSLAIKVLDSYNYCRDSLSFDCYLDSTIIYTYTDSFQIAQSWDDGCYSIKAMFFYKDHPIGWGSRYFNIRTGLVSTTLIPDTIITGQDTMKLAINIVPESLVVYSALLNYQLECPSKTYTDTLLLDSLKDNDTLNIPITIPQDSLIFGDYSFNYSLFSLDTINGGYDFSHDIHLELESSKYRYYWLDTLYFSISLENRGRFALPIWVIGEVEKPQGNYLDSVEINLELDTDTTLYFQTLVELDTPYDSYQLWARVLSGNSIKEVYNYYRVIPGTPDIIITKSGVRIRNKI